MIPCHAPLEGVSPRELELSAGAWVNLKTQGEWVRAQLTWTSPRGGLYMFISASGMAHSMTRRTLDRLLGADALQIVSRGGVVEGALDAVAQQALRNAQNDDGPKATTGDGHEEGCTTSGPVDTHFEATGLTTTTFGFDALQDRIWMRVHEQEQTIWFTRRLMGQFLGPVVEAFEQATPGAQGGAPPAQRAAIEHDLSLHETPPGQAAPPDSGRAGATQPRSRSPTGFVHPRGHPDQSADRDHDL